MPVPLPNPYLSQLRAMDRNPYAETPPMPMDQEVGGAYGPAVNQARDLEPRERWGEGSAHVPGLVLRALDMLTEPMRRAYSRYTGGEYEGNPYEQMMLAAMDASDAQYPESGGGLPGPAAVHWPTGEVFQKAFLHRGIYDPNEITWLAKLLQRGGRSEKPTSLLTPQYLATFQNNPHGFLWHVKDPGKIKHVGAEDLWSQPKYEYKGRSLPPYEDLAYDLESYKSGGYGVPSNEEAAQIQKMLDLIDARSDFITERWNPLKETIDPKTESLVNVFQKQKELMQDPTDWFGAKFTAPPPPESPYLHHNEIVYNIGDPAELAGVRVPGPDAGMPRTKDSLEGALRDFAEQMHVPIYEFPSQWTRGDQLRMLEDAIQSGAQGGTWEKAPWNGRTITSRWGR